MQVLLDVPTQQDWLSLMPLLDRLGVNFTIQSTTTNEVDAQEIAQSEQDWAIIMRGIKIDDMDDFVNDFEKSRQDRPLPFRD